MIVVSEKNRHRLERHVDKSMCVIVLKVLKLWVAYARGQMAARTIRIGIPKWGFIYRLMNEESQEWICERASDQSRDPDAKLHLRREGSVWYASDVSGSARVNVFRCINGNILHAGRHRWEKNSNAEDTIMSPDVWTYCGSFETTLLELAEVTWHEPVTPALGDDERFRDIARFSIGPPNKGFFYTSMNDEEWICDRASDKSKDEEAKLQLRREGSVWYASDVNGSARVNVWRCINENILLPGEHAWEENSNAWTIRSPDLWKFCANFNTEYLPVNPATW